MFPKTCKRWTVEQEEELGAEAGGWGGGKYHRVRRTESRWPLKILNFFLRPIPSAHHLPFTYRPALPEKKGADLSTLNEVGYQIRI